MEIWHKFLSYILMFYLSPKKKKATLPLVSKLFCFVSNIAVCIFLLRGCKQSNSLTTTRENINIFMNVTYLNMFQDIQYDSITLYKVNFI